MPRLFLFSLDRLTQCELMVAAIVIIALALCGVGYLNRYLKERVQNDFAVLGGMVAVRVVVILGVFFLLAGSYPRAPRCATANAQPMHNTSPPRQMPQQFLGCLCR